MKRKKWPSTHTFCFRTRLRRRMTTPFGFANWYGPKQLSKHIGCDTESSRKIFESSRSQTCDPPNTLFLVEIWMFSMILPSKHEWNVKNGHQLTLFALESDWDIVWPSRLLLWIDMILNNIPNTLVVMQKALENFLEPLEFRKHPQKKLVALTFDSEIGVKIYLLRGYEIKKWP